MANSVTTIQSLKAVDAWIDVINANINGGVRTAFKASRLRFAGSNTQLDRAPTSTSLPLQLPEPSLLTANTVIDWTQGAVTSSTETSHLAIQGEGYFLVADPATIDASNGHTVSNGQAKFYITRDGEFHTNQHGLLVNSAGYYLVTVGLDTNGGKQVLAYDTGGYINDFTSIRAVYNDLDSAVPAVGTTQQSAVRLSDFLNQSLTTDIAGNALPATAYSLFNVASGKQNLTYTQFGSTIFNFGFQATADATTGTLNMGSQFGIDGSTSSDATVLSKSLEASNSSMTQSVPELSLAQKLFSALTKVLQINQTNQDSVLNLVR